MADAGRFITVEGAEGVGKSTNIAFLRDYLKKRGIDVLVTREPGGTPLGEDIRGVLLAVRDAPVAPLAELLMIFAARAQHLSDVIIPALAEGKWVLCDRFTDATYAYQGGGRGLDAALIAKLENLVQDELRPDYTILLDVAVATGLARARGRGELDRIEQETLAFFERVRETYLHRSRQEQARFRVVNAEEPLEQVHANIAQIADELIALTAGPRTA